jgi:hypothetical protein
VTNGRSITLPLFKQALACENEKTGNYSINYLTSQYTLSVITYLCRIHCQTSVRLISVVAKSSRQELSTHAPVYEKSEEQKCYLLPDISNDRCI